MVTPAAGAHVDAMHFQLESRVGNVLARAVDELIAAAPNGHYSQQPGWPRLEPGSAGARHLLFTGRRDSRGGELEVAGWVRLRRVPVFGTVADVIRGPAARSPAALVDGIDALGQLLGKSALALRVDPYVSDAAADEVARGLRSLGFTPMRDEWSHRRTLEVDIDRAPEALLASFAPATRRHVRKALAMKLEIREGLDDDGLERFCRLYGAMVARKGTAPQSPAFLRSLGEFCRAQPRHGFILSAWRHGELMSAIMVATIGPRAVYAYGASSSAEPSLPKSHLVHFLAMQRARERGCRVYDLGGFGPIGVGGPDGHAARSATERINYFKHGFGGRERDFLSPHERLTHPLTWRAIRFAQRLRRRLDCRDERA